MLKINQKVNHPEFGQGVICNIENRVSPYNTPYDDIITVEFENEMLSELEKHIIAQQTPTKYRRFTETTIQPYLV